MGESECNKYLYLIVTALVYFCNSICRTPLRRPRPPVLSKPNSEEDKKVKFTDHRGNVKEGIITGTSVSTSVSSSTSVQQSDQVKSEPKKLSPAELLRQRLKLLYSQRRRFY